MPTLKTKLAQAEQRINDLQAQLLALTQEPKEPKKFKTIEAPTPPDATVIGELVEPSTALMVVPEDEFDAACPDVTDVVAARRQKRIQGERLTHWEINALLHFHKQGKTQAAIARRLNCTQGCVSLILKEFTSTKAAAKRHLEANALKLAEVVSSTTDAKVALKALEKLGEITKDADAGKSGAPVVMVGLKVDLNTL